MNRGAYQLDGKNYLTVNGLCKALLKKHDAARAIEVSGVRKDRSLSVYAQGSTGRIEVAVYLVDAPKLGQVMKLTQVAVYANHTSRLLKEVQS